MVVVMESRSGREERNGEEKDYGTRPGGRKSPGPADPGLVARLAEGTCSAPVPEEEKESERLRGEGIESDG